jgi:Ca-activated chloride channel family protein
MIGPAAASKACTYALLCATFCILGGGAGAQGPPADALPSAKLLSPEIDSYATGTVMLRASSDESTPLENVTFFVDGRQVCIITQRPFECEWDAGPEVSAHQVRAVFNLPEGGRVARTVRTKGLGFADKVNVEAVQVTVTVTDDGGHFVPGIPRSAFKILEDGKPQTVTYFASEDVPLELIVAVDISGSMTASMPKLKKAVKSFLGAVPPNDEVTLLGFNDNIFAPARKTTDPAERMRAVDRLAPWGATALYDAILRGIDMLGRQIGRKALVVFTDGEDQGSHVAIEDVERRLQASDVTLYMIAQGRGISQEYLKKTMQRLTVPTGGRTFTTENVDALQGAFEELLDELSNQYLLGYQSTTATRDDSWREIKVQVEGHSGIRARQGYRATPYR